MLLVFYRRYKCGLYLVFRNPHKNPRAIIHHISLFKKNTILCSLSIIGGDSKETKKTIQEKKKIMSCKLSIYREREELNVIGEICKLCINSAFSKIEISLGPNTKGHELE